MINFVLSICVMFILGCDQKPQERQYTEITISAPQSMAMPPVTDPHAGMDMSMAPAMPTANHEVQDKITWDVPANWVEQGPSQMRLATLRLKSAPDAFDCSIISLPGGAGGLVANLKRWMGQVDINVSDEELQRFINASANNIFDFTQLQKGQDLSTKSMIAAMIELDGTTVFVKLTAGISSVNDNKAAFLALVNSVRLK